MYSEGGEKQPFGKQKIRLQGKTQELNFRDEWAPKEESDLKILKPPVDRR